jgi:hypothetical protein
MTGFCVVCGACIISSEVCVTHSLMFLATAHTAVTGLLYVADSWSADLQHAQCKAAPGRLLVTDTIVCNGHHHIVGCNLAHPGCVHAALLVPFTTNEQQAGQPVALSSRTQRLPHRGCRRLQWGAGALSQ